MLVIMYRKGKTTDRQRTHAHTRKERRLNSKKKKIRRKRRKDGTRRGMQARAATMTLQDGIGWTRNASHESTDKRLGKGEGKERERFLTANTNRKGGKRAHT